MPDKSVATGVVLLHAVDGQTLAAWVDATRHAARSFSGFRSLRAAVTHGRLAPAVAATFDTVNELNAWLDSGVLTTPNIEGVQRKSSDLLIVQGHRLPPGTAVFYHDVIDGESRDFVAVQEKISEAAARYPGCTSTVLLPPAPLAGIDQWTSVLSFRTDEQLSAWWKSKERERRLDELRSHLSQEFHTLAVDAPFGSILRIDGGRPQVTPTWKTAMLVLLVLYPTVMTLSRFLGPALTDFGAQPWLSMWLSQIVSVTAMTYALMPAATRLFTRWLDPVDGAPVQVSVLGALMVAAVYAATLWLFATVNWLDFWTHA